MERDYYNNAPFADNNDDVIFEKDVVISVQPFSERGPRLPLPISTISGSESSQQYFLPITGLSLLHDVPEITIEQTIERDDLALMIESANKFLIKTDGQVIFAGYENSSATQRLFCGSRREFLLQLFDRSHQEAMYMSRRLACSLPLLGCYLQHMDVFEPPCSLLGSVQQKWTTTGSAFSIRDKGNYELYTFTGPSAAPCRCHHGVTFTVLDVTGVFITTIEHGRDANNGNYKLKVKFPTNFGLRDRALLLASGMLMEYLFFQSSNCNATCCFT